MTAIEPNGHGVVMLGKLLDPRKYTSETLKQHVRNAIEEHPFTYVHALAVQHITRDMANGAPVHVVSRVLEATVQSLKEEGIVGSTPTGALFLMSHREDK